jgi:hypothetical protein
MSDQSGQALTLAELAQKFEQRGYVPGGEAELRSRTRGLRDLFTRDVTREGLTDLFQRDPQDAFRFFTRNIDFAALSRLP